MRFIMALAGAVLVIASMQVAAKAATIDLGDVTNSSESVFGGAPSSSPSISDDIKFSLTTSSNVIFTVANVQALPQFDISGFLVTTSDFILTVGPAGTFSFAGVLAAGDYLAQVTGTAIGTLGGLYQISVTTAATPIPAAMLLFISALGGLAGFAGLRRRVTVAA